MLLSTEENIDYVTIYYVENIKLYYHLLKLTMLLSTDDNIKLCH